MTYSIANAQAIESCDAIADSCDLGSTNAQATLVIYDGTPPARVDAALSGNNVLSQHDMTTPGGGGAFGSAVDVPASNLARATANAIADDTSADATGTATFFRILDRDNTPRLQGTAGTSGTSLILNSASISAGQRVEISSLTLDVAEA